MKYGTYRYNMPEVENGLKMESLQSGVFLVVAK